MIQAETDLDLVTLCSRTPLCLEYEVRARAEVNKAVKSDSSTPCFLQLMLFRAVKALFRLQ